MKIKGAIFDLDGTLLDSMKVWNTLGERYLKSRGIEPEPGLYGILKPMSLPQAARYLRETYAIEDSEEDIVGQINGLIENEYRSSFRLKESVEGFLRKLRARKVRMCIATATARPLVEAALQRLGIDGFFCGIVTCYEAGVGKEKPDVFLRALELLGTSMAETVVFEDALHAIKTAKAAGFTVAAVYDACADSDRDEIITVSDRYLNSFNEWEMDEE